MTYSYAKLGDIATYINGYAFKPKDHGTKGLPIIRIQDLTGSSNDRGYYAGEYPSKIEINNGDVLISWSASLGVYVWNKGKALLNQHIFKVKFDKKDIDKDYFVYAVRFNLTKLKQLTHGATMKHVVKKDFENVLIPYPSLKRQREIAYVLDKLERNLTQKSQELDKLDELIKARFVEMFGDPVLNSNNYKNNYLEQYIEFITSGSRGWSKYYKKDGKYWFITIKNVKNSHITKDNMQTITPPDNQEAKRTKVKEGDLLISITADLGRTGVVTKDIADHGSYINQHLTCLRLNTDRINPVYVSYFLESSAGKRQFSVKNQNGVKAGLNFKAIKKLKILIPPLSLQNKFVNFVQQVDKSKVAVQKSLDETQKLFDSLMQKYFG